MSLDTLLSIDDHLTEEPRCHVCNEYGHKALQCTGKPKNQECTLCGDIEIPKCSGRVHVRSARDSFYCKDCAEFLRSLSRTNLVDLGTIEILTPNMSGVEFVSAAASKDSCDPSTKHSRSERVSASNTTDIPNTVTCIKSHFNFNICPSRL
ncbi:hypothetical protein ILUMI_01104 [Ignelater luminosus]|uniref:Uncharacterized protein n=1 Tax=Ignelater luminosus TaxID=2038154 RepID=A0A8K0DKN5_IGNLU|nr:hypothetical protein ILUMI_01104 [Ignelater luminosus]